MTATGAPAAAAPIARTATTAVTATSAWLRPIVCRAHQVVDDDVPGVIDAVDAGHGVELGQVGGRQGAGISTSIRIDREVAPGGRQLLAEPLIDQGILYIQSLDLLRSRLRERG